MASPSLSPIDGPAVVPAVRTFHARKGRLSAAKRRALDELLPRYALTVGDQVDALDLGCGSGEAALALAGEWPELLVLAVDVHSASIANLLRRAEVLGLENLRVVLGDGLALLRERIEPGSLQLLQVLFPDPWPKARHHHRRLVQPPFAGLAAARLAPGGVLELATDRADYALQMARVLGGESRLRGGPALRRNRPATFYELRALAEERLVQHLRYVRLDTDSPGLDEAGAQPERPATSRTAPRCEPGDLPPQVPPRDPTR